MMSTPKRPSRMDSTIHPVDTMMPITVEAIHGTFSSLEFPMAQPMHPAASRTSPSTNRSMSRFARTARI